MLSSNFAVYHRKKSTFIKKTEATELSGLWIKVPLNQVFILGPILFWGYKMNKIINKFLLAGDQLILEIHLRQPGYTYSACEPFP